MTANTAIAYGSTPVGASIEGYWSVVTKGGICSEDGSAVMNGLQCDLFAVIGTTFGAGEDGSTTFNLPDSLKVGVSVNLNSSDTEFATLGQKYGNEGRAAQRRPASSAPHGIYAEAGTAYNLKSGTCRTIQSA